jgi:tRNA pseudouridine38-40 synthase
VHGVRLVVAYEGTDFCGWQRQPGQRSVQGVLEDAVASMCGHRVAVRGAGRTDAGVHAEGQVAAFDSLREIPPRGWMLGLNQRLPEDVAVRHAEPAPVGYEPRFDAVDKTYRYLVLLGQARDPHWRRRAWHLARVRASGKAPDMGDSHTRDGEPSGAVDGVRTLDLDAIRQASVHLVGTHDFAAFRAADDGRAVTTRTLHALEVHERFAGHPDLVAFEVRGDAFLKQMVRILVGTLVEVGRGTRTPSSVAALLEPGARRAQAGPTAPPHGLTLVRVTLGRH